MDTFGGRVHIEWNPSAAVSPLGQMAFFIEFLKTGGLFEPWVSDYPLHYTSPNALTKRDVLDTVLLVRSGWTPSLSAYQHSTCGPCRPAMAGHEQGGERRCGAPLYKRRVTETRGTGIMKWLNKPRPIGQPDQQV